MAGSCDKPQEQVLEASHAAVAEHVELACHHARLDELGGGRGEDAVPEEAHLLPQRRLRLHHPVNPVRTAGGVVAQVRLIDVVAADEVLRHGVRLRVSAALPQWLRNPAQGNDRVLPEWHRIPPA